MALPLLDEYSTFVLRWSAQSPATRYSTLSVLLVSLVGLLWSLARKYITTGLAASTKVGANSRAPACPPELLKNDLKNGVANVYTSQRELQVPFDIGEVRISKLLVHPIKVRQGVSPLPSLTERDAQSCRGTSATEWRYGPEGLEVCLLHPVLSRLLCQFTRGLGVSASCARCASTCMSHSAVDLCNEPLHLEEIDVVQMSLAWHIAPLWSHAGHIRHYKYEYANTAPE